MCIGGAPVNLSVSGGTTYTWSPTTGLSSTTGSAVTANPSVTSTYAVTGATSGCTGRGAVTITVNSLPAKPVVVGSITYCQNSSSVALTASANTGNTLTWYTAFPLSGGSTTAPIPSTVNAGTFTYYVTQTNPTTGCISDTSKIEVLVTPDIANNTISANQTICAGSSVAVLSSGSLSGGTGSYTFQWQQSADNGTTWTNIVGATNTTYNPGNLAAGIYQYRRLVTSGQCNNISNAVSIIVTAKPTVRVTASSNPICEGSSTSLTANGATTYLWSPSSAINATTGSSVIASPTTNTTYQVIGTINGCVDTASIDVTVIARPVKPTAVRSVEYCVNASASVLGATAAPGNTLTWYTSFPLTAGSAVPPRPLTSTTGTFTYFVTQTNSNGCVSDTAIITVNVRPLPSVNFDLPVGICMPNGVANFTNRTIIADNSALSYTWNFGDNSPVSTTINSNHVYDNSGSYSVVLTAASPYGCTNSLQKQLSSFYEKPVADFDVNPTTFCQGQENFFTDKSNPSASTITKWWWDFGDNKTDATKNPTHRYSRPDTFNVKMVVTTAIGCVSDTLDKDVIVYLQPRIDAGPSFVVPIGTTIQFKATVNDTTSVRLNWTPAGDLSDPTALRPSITVVQNQTYTLTAVGAGNCIAVDTLSVRILKQIEVPNVFSPNGDGTNDYWLIPNLADYPDAKVEVYNRWGQQVLLSYGYSKPWDGNYLGKALPLATYYYVITLNNGLKPVTGSVTIIK